MKKVCAVVMAAGFVLGACLPALSASAEQSRSKYIKGTFSFWAHDNNHDLTDSYVYTDSFFDGSSHTADQHLAITSMVLAEVSISSKDTDYPGKSRNVQDFLNQIGFLDIEINPYYMEKMQMNTLGVAVAYKPLGDTVLLAIVPRSAGYEAEWGGNFNVGSSGLHEGFRLGRDIALNFAKAYVSNHADAFAGKTVKVWTAGYSRGAGVANLIGAALVDDSVGFLGLEVQSENIFDYTFGTPLTAAADLSPRAEQYSCIHNYFSDYDPVPMMPFAQWGFERYGQDIELDVHNAETKEKMLTFLADTNPAVYQSYTTAQDPDNFQAKTLGVSADRKITIVPDKYRSVTQRDFLLTAFANLAATTVPSRDIYAAEYEQAVTEVTALLIGEDDDTVAAFVKGAGSSSSLKPLAVMLFLYNWAEQYIDGKGQDTLLFGNWRAELLPAPVAEGETTGNEVADEVLNSDTYREIYSEATSETLAADYGIALNTYGDLMRIYSRIAGKYMDAVLRAGLGAIGFSGERLEEHPLIQDDNAEKLAEVAAQLLFGTSDSLSLSGAISKVKNAVTIAGNNFMRVHNNEVILSWLRAMDTDPLDEKGNVSAFELTGNATWAKTSAVGLEMKATGGTITGFRIDNQESDQCRISEDGLSIVISAELLKALSTGRHTVTVVLADGEISREIEVAETAPETETQTADTETFPDTATGTQTGGSGSMTESSTDAKAGKSTNVSVGLVLMLAVLAAVIVAIAVSLNRKRKNGQN